MNIEKELSELKSMVMLLTNKLSESFSTSSELYGNYLMQWFNLYKKPINRENTSIDMEKYINNYIIPKIGDIPINILNGNHLQTLLISIPKSNTRNKIALILNGSLKKAVKLRLIQFNPFDLVEIKSHRSRHYIPLSFQSQNIILSNINNEKYKAVIWILICTGLRVGEFLALDFRKIDYKNGKISVSRTINIKTGDCHDYAKTETSIRTVTFLPELKPYLIYIKNALKEGNNLTYNSIKCYFSKLYNRLKLIKLNIHSFRHTFVSMCYYVGIKEKVIQQLVGHATLEMTMNTYTHVFEPGNSDFLPYFEKLEKHLKRRPTNREIFNTS